MRDVSKFYLFSIFCDIIVAGFVSGNSFDVIERVDEVVNITISDHLREVLLCTVIYGKVACVFPMVISSEFRMRQCRDDDHREDAPHFIFQIMV